MVNGASPGPVPAFQTRASNSRLTRSSWRTWPHLKLRRKVPRVEGALAVKPSTRAVPPARSTSASSMQSPPARAEATRVIILSPVFARPGAPPRSTCFRRSWGRPRRRARVAGRISPALATRRGRQRGCGYGRVCSVAASIGCSLFPGGFLFQNHYPRFTGAPSSFFMGCPHGRPSVDSGLTGLCLKTACCSKSHGFASKPVLPFIVVVPWQSGKEHSRLD